MSLIICYYYLWYSPRCSIQLVNPMTYCKGYSIWIYLYLSIALNQTSHWLIDSFIHSFIHYFLSTTGSVLFLSKQVRNQLSMFRSLSFVRQHQHHWFHLTQRVHPQQPREQSLSFWTCCMYLSIHLSSIFHSIWDQSIYLISYVRLFDDYFCT